MNKPISILIACLLFATHLYCVIGHPTMKESVLADASSVMVLDLGLGDPALPFSETEECGHTGCLCEGALVVDVVDCDLCQLVARSFLSPVVFQPPRHIAQPENVRRTQGDFSISGHCVRAIDRCAELQSFLI